MGMAGRRSTRNRISKSSRCTAFESLERRELLATLNVGPGQTFTSIQAAVNAASSGDTIQIASTVNDTSFVENVNLSLMGSAVGKGPGNLTIRGDTDAGTTIAPNGGPVFFNSAPFTGNLTFENLTLRSAVATANEDKGLQLNQITGDITIRSVNVFDSADMGIDILNSGGSAGAQSKLTIQDVDISRNFDGTTPIGMRLSNLNMLISMQDTRISEASDAGIVIAATGTTNTLVTLSSVSIDGGSDTIVGNDGIRATVSDTSTLSMMLAACSLKDLPGNSIDVVASGTATFNTSVYSLTAITNESDMVRQTSEPAVRYVAQNSAKMNIFYDFNVFTEIHADALQIQALNTSTVNATLRRNQFAGIGSAVDHEPISVIGNASSNATVNLVVADNDVDFTSTTAGVSGSGILLRADGTSTYNARFEDNRISYSASSNQAAGIDIKGVSTNTAKLNLAITNNSILFPTTGLGIRVNPSSTTISANAMKVEMTGTTLSAYLQSANPGTTVSSPSSSTFAAAIGAFLDRAPLVLGDLVWMDANKNGTQDSAETGVADVVLTLTGTETTSGAQVTRKTMTDSEGGYFFGALLPGTYTVTMSPVAGLELTGLNRKTPSSTDNDEESDSDFQQGIRQATVTLTAGASNSDLDAGLVAFNGFIWNNQLLSEDVDDNGQVTPIDALLVIIQLNSSGPRTLAAPTASFTPAPFIDVNHDGLVTPLDALLVIIRLNSASGEGEAPTAATASAANTSAASPLYYPPEWFTTSGSSSSADDDDGTDAFFSDLGA
jgi:hypothetical protein